jgi:FAD/FMN-containing dehydrogenase
MVRIGALDGREVQMLPEVLRALQSSLRGSVLTRESAEYDEARTIWNAMIDRRPAVIVRCSDAGDVQRVVRFAAEHELLVAVRGGGHNIAGSALCDGGIVIDLSLMKHVHVDTASQIAVVEPGCTLADFDAVAQRSALAVPLGINSTTGVAGLTLGGGFGWLTRKYGMTVDHLVAADVVIADGTLLHTSETEHEDLFWAIRGGGGNFGVVTRFEFTLQSVGPEVLSGLVIHPLADAPSVLRFYREFTAAAPEELTVWVVLRQAPPLPFLPAEWHGREVLVLALCYCGTDLAEGERALAPLRAHGNPLAVALGPTPYAAWQQAFDALNSPGARNYWKSHDFTELSDELLDGFVESATRLPTASCEIIITHIAGAPGRVPVNRTAYANRATKWGMNVHSRWDTAGLEHACIAWARDVFRQAAPHASGSVYVNFMTGEEADRVSAAYGPNYARLRQVKNRYDPRNQFRVNQNIAPFAPAAPVVPVSIEQRI